MNANTKAFKEKTDALVANIKMACQYAMETSLKNMESNPEEKETVLEQHDIPKEEVAVQSQKTFRSESAPSQEAMETKPDPGMMQSVEVHQEIPKEDATVMPVGGLRKRRRDRNLAAGRRQKPKERIQATCESRRLAVTNKKSTRRATVAWRKRNVFRRTVTQGNCGPQSTLTAAGIMMTRHAGVARSKKNFVRKDCTSDKDERVTQTVGPLRKNLRMHQKRKCGTKDLCGGQPQYMRMEETTTSGIGGCSSEKRSHVDSGVTLKKILYAIFRWKFANQVVGTSTRLQRMKKWTLWRGRPPPKRKKR
jgi:hypothetical protein